MKRIVLLLVFTISTASAASAQTPQVSVSAPTVRQSDSLLNGALIGAGTAVASGLVFCTLMEPWDNCRDDVGPMIKIGAIGAGIGMAIDALIRKKIYQSASGATEVHAAPMVGRRAKGLQLSVSF
jgi:hypothetical protein